MENEQKKPNPSEVIDAMLKGDQNPRFDIDGDGDVDIHDVTALIDQQLDPKPDPQDDGVFEVNGIQFRMIKVEAGKFLMGATNEPSALSYEYPQHEVTITKDYWIGETQVTQALWKAVMGVNPSLIKGDNLPVEKVTWNDCQEFISKLNQITGKQFRLPTEAEWEFAAIGGNETSGNKYSGSNIIDNVAWNKANANGTSHPVKEKQSNELGLFDMSGNVNEWCSDWYGAYTASAAVDPKGNPTGSYKVYRGGAYTSNAVECRCHYRYMMSPSKRAEYIGLRLAL